MEVIYSKERNKMITRINLVKDENGEIVFQNKEDIPKNWVVECKENLLVAVGLSKANPKRERITLFPVKEGSLFLHNSSFDYYCYFRDKELQKILDKYGIQKIVAIEHTLFITLHVVNGKVINPILYMNGFECIDSEKTSFITDSNGQDYFQIKLEFIRQRTISDIHFLIQMGKDEKNDFFNIISIAYFLVTLIMIAIKFGIVIEINLANKIFEIFYYYITIPVLVVSLILLVFYIVKSRRTKSSEDVNKISKKIASLLSNFTISFEVFASLFRTFNIDLISCNWFLLTLYITMISVILNIIIYLYFRNKVSNEYNLYNQNAIINKYIIYSILVSFILAIILPNITIHFGIISAI